MSFYGIRDEEQRATLENEVLGWISEARGIPTAPKPPKSFNQLAEEEPFWLYRFIGEHQLYLEYNVPTVTSLAELAPPDRVQIARFICANRLDPAGSSKHLKAWRARPACLPQSKIRCAGCSAILTPATSANPEWLSWAERDDVATLQAYLALREEALPACHNCDLTPTHRGLCPNCEIPATETDRQVERELEKALDISPKGAAEMVETQLLPRCPCGHRLQVDLDGGRISGCHVETRPMTAEEKEALVGWEIVKLALSELRAFHLLQTLRSSLEAQPWP